MLRVLLAACLLVVSPALAQENCAPSLEGRWIDDASSNIKGKQNQVTGFILRRQGEGFYLTTIYDSGARAVPRGLYKGSTTELVAGRVLGLDDLMAMFSGTVIGPIAVNQLASHRPAIQRIYRLSPDGNSVMVGGNTIMAWTYPNGTLDNFKHQDLEYMSMRAPWPKPCEAIKRAAEWDGFKIKANAYRDAKDKPALSDEVRQYGMLGVDAVNGKNFDDALNQFEAGLALNPLWPNGHYNTAMIYAQMLDYESAIYHMKAYLELTPADDKEFQANKDRLLLWQGKLKQQLAEAPQVIPED